jgi:hypothetical protein
MASMSTPSARPDTPLDGRAGDGGTGDDAGPAGLEPAAFARQALDALDASEGRRRRRKRDTTPDAVGLGIKRDLLERLEAEGPAAGELELWLLRRAVAAPASGPVRALCAEILTEYRYASVDPRFRGWLAEGAPSADADPSDDQLGPTRVRIHGQESRP